VAHSQIVKAGLQLTLVDVELDRAVADQSEHVRRADPLGEQVADVGDQVLDVDGVEALLDVALEEVPLLEGACVCGRLVGVEGAVQGVEAEEVGVLGLDVSVARAGEADQAGVVADEPAECVVEGDVAEVAVEGLFGAGVGDAVSADYAAFVVDVLREKTAWKDKVKVVSA